MYTIDNNDECSINYLIEIFNDNTEDIFVLLFNVFETKEIDIKRIESILYHNLIHKVDNIKGYELFREHINELVTRMTQSNFFEYHKADNSKRTHLTLHPDIVRHYKLSKI